MTNEEFTASVNAEIRDTVRKSKIAEIIRRDYAAMPESELVPMRERAKGMTDEELDGRDRARDMRLAK